LGRIISIDYGRKRTGIAVSDPERIIATGLATVDTGQLVWFLKDYFNKESVSEAIIGYPKNLDGTATDITAKVEKFYGQFQKLFPHIPVQLIDERYTSKMAFQAMIDSGLGKTGRSNKALVDEVSATILLQGYMSN
jgi:putative Holliday junction resolvase